MRIGLVDDDDTSLDFVAQSLANSGHHCSGYRSARDLIAALQRDTFDLLIVDWNMPDINGMDTLRWVQDHVRPCPPILMLTSRSDKDDIALALNSGADDYIIKPETAGVIAARVEAVLRRTAGRTSDERIEIFGRYSFDRATETVMLDGEAIALTPKEFALARLFFVNRERPLSRTYLLQAVWKNVAELSTRTLDMHVSRVRAKLRLRADNGYLLQTVFGYGYRLEMIEHAIAPAE
jgi:DNA-binding response OmpR family regulator